ncbi:carboxypeptidase regulatory-like domain-containing protein [Caldicoprobacter algeriensis]|uniref:carboxypeptidase regulatory-like domain-containing protein n=1 Tax=Caldicoprobacter algeriensis TaxID=699281 RepID=UPI0020792BAB|nr:carboxypeptidase regulatory-like domain-containing protein [Caldicoprobacter algeriensis]MCM8901779.1 carboxypeptidase regulatory-like domain-containing protein [Caldicoprobacter algeriensis]
MDLQEKLLEEKVEKAKTKESKILESDSIQYNCQDLDQEQRVDVNPTQSNAQNIHIYISSNKNNLAARITGVTYFEESKDTAPNVKIRLFFGHERVLPVYETNSDNNGNFVIEDIPPGYYTLYAELGDLKYYSHYIKVLPGQSIHESVLLR